MENRSFLLCIVLACSIWMVQGRSLKIRIDDDELGEPDVDVQGLPGMCWGCKWALNKLKKKLGSNSTAEAIKAKLRSVCDGIGLLKSQCRKFVDANLAVLIEELTTTDDVRTICVNVGVCKQKDLEMIFYPNKQESRRIKISEVN
ncbi:antimicrobial peptide NK-lysin-like [Xiphophorus maculatus]|uniref:Antimicrobial peptide NK-lysin-like n=1 Tax=Xiphophorus maculatus TaxID=8083 RepID=M4A049_XIPMA|nr:antimicrobial peptide NK-lysin-like [Xiphophorus maculatus]